MDFPNTKLQQPVHPRIAVKDIKRVITSLDFNWWIGYDGVSIEALDEFIKELESLKEVK